MQKNSFNEFQFKEYESIMKLNANQDDKLEGVQVDSLEERIETVSNFLKYRELLSLIASNNTFKEFSLNNGTRVKVFSKNGLINISEKTSNGEIINIVVSTIDASATAETLYQIATEVKNK